MHDPAAHPALPTILDVEAAGRRLEGVVRQTPLLEAPRHALPAIAGTGRLVVKAEPLQLTGSFKLRGAYNAVAALPESLRRRGVVAASSGNHAQGVAAAAAMFGIPAAIVMPADAPAAKREGTLGWGAEIVAYDRFGEDREAIVARLVAERGHVPIHGYDDADVIAGQGTCGLEIAEGLARSGIAPDLAVIPASGGGLLAGCALALQDRYPGLPVWAAEPEAFDDHRRSFAAGQRVGAPGGSSVCDALLAPRPGALTFAVNRTRVAGSTGVDDDDALAAMAWAFRVLKLVVEPGGAAALAALLSGRIDWRDRTVVVVCSGGNVDPAVFRRAIAFD